MFGELLYERELQVGRLRRGEFGEGLRKALFRSVCHTARLMQDSPF